GFDPWAYFDSAAISRRQAQGLPLSDWYDLPLCDAYVDSVCHTGAAVRHRLRWFNGVSVLATAEQLEGLKQLSFVTSIESLGQRSLQLASDPRPPRNYDTLLSLQRGLLELDSLLARGLSGRGVRIAILDAGFKEADTHPALAQVREAGRLVATHDFFGVDDKVFHHSRHGTEVMSCISGHFGDRQLGAAPNAEFVLARVEHHIFEPAREEDNWLAAVEWADRLGARIINSSLTYSSKRYRYEEMDGKTAPVSQAASIATQKGILVVNSIGNEGLEKKRYLGAPADVPEVLTVGGSLPMLEERIPFSSFGPNARGELKPELSAPAYVLAAWKRGSYSEVAGTSFAAPLVAGVAACLLEEDSSLMPGELHQRLCKAGHRYPYFDHELGYGVLKAGRLFHKPEKSPPAYKVGFKGDSVILAFDTLRLAADSAHFPYGRMLYFHLEDPTGQLISTQTVRIPNGAHYYYF
ncbi:MAG: S8 family serine peptidase, partial [Bacteroidota bacterium]